MRITTQLCTALPVTCGAGRPARPRRIRAFSTTASISKPYKRPSGCVTRRLFRILDPDPLAPVGVIEAGDEASVCPGLRASRPAPLPASPDFPARSASPCTLRTIGLAERRLECKKKVSARDLLNRLRAGGRNPTSAPLWKRPDGRCQSFNACCRKSQSLDGQRHEFARKLLARRCPDDQH